MGLITIGIILVAIFMVIFYIPTKLKEQEEKQSLYVKELYIRINRLESKIDKILESNKNEFWNNDLNVLIKIKYKFIKR